MAFQQKGDNKSTEVWNVAPFYTKTEIYDRLHEIDTFYYVAKFGADSLNNQVIMTNQLGESTIAKTRFLAFQNIYETLLVIIGNADFKIQNNKEKWDKFKVELKLINSSIKNKSIYQENIDDVAKTNKFELNELLFDRLLAKMMKIKWDMLTPLNDNGFIFPSSDEVDLDKLKNEMTFGG